MVDFDTITSKVNMYRIALEIYKQYPNNSWSALTVNCDGPYYDIWALRIPAKIWNKDIHGKIWDAQLEYDCWYQVPNNGVATECVKSFQKVIPVDMPLIETESSFNGMGVYRIKNVIKCRYNTCDDSHNFIQCEHVYFHRAIRNLGGRIFICPALVLQCQFEHIQ